MSKRKTSALRKEQDTRYTHSKQTDQTFYMKESKTIDFNQAQSKAKPRRSIELIPKTINQENYILALQNDETDIVVVSGPAGTGKTYLAMLAAIKALRNGECEHIILTRPAVGVDDEKHGFLPGNLVAKMEPWTRPLLDVLREYYRPQEIAALIDEQTVEIAPLAYMRGRTFKNAWVIADEMQNATPAQVKMLMTRIGQGSRIVITGDVEQADRSRGDNGLLDLCNRLEDSPVKGIAVCRLEGRDIQRHPLIGSVLELYAD